MAEKSKILIIGATGFIGKFIAKASVKAGHPTFMLTRKSALTDPEKSKTVDELKDLGVELEFGDLNDKKSLLDVVKKVDVVISTVGGKSATTQFNLIEAIKEAGNIKRFLPSEFGLDADRGVSVGPAQDIFDGKAKIRRAIEAANIPYTYVVCNGFGNYFLPTLGQKDTTTPPREEITILGDGKSQAVFITEEDIASITIKTVDDPLTLNKALVFRPPGNTMSFEEIVKLWELKIGKTLKRKYVSDEEILKEIEDAGGKKIMLTIWYSTFVKGSATNFELNSESDVEASKLYSDFKFTTIDEYLTKMV